MEIFLGEKSGIRPPLPSKLSSYLSWKGFDFKGTFVLPFKIWSHFQLVMSLSLLFVFKLNQLKFKLQIV